MKRTINEKKAWRRIFLSFPLVLLSITLMIGSAVENPFPGVYLFGIVLLVSLAILCFAFYSLGWEYKRIEVQGYRE